MASNIWERFFDTGCPTVVNFVFLMETPIEFVRNLQFFHIMLNTLHLNACLKIICQSLRGCHPLFLHNIFILHYWFSGFPFMMTMVKMVMMMQVVVAKIAILLGSWWIGDGGRTTCKAKKKPIQVSSHYIMTPRNFGVTEFLRSGQVWNFPGKWENFLSLLLFTTKKETHFSPIIIEY